MSRDMAKNNSGMAIKDRIIFPEYKKKINRKSRGILRSVIKFAIITTQFFIFSEKQTIKLFL